MMFLVEKGGWVIWPILAGSVLGVAIILERAVYFVRHRLHGRRFLDELRSRLSRDGAAGTQAWCSQLRAAAGRVAAVYLEHVDHDARLREEAVWREGGMALEGAERRLRALALIAQICPLLGLLGTVLGMIRVFQRVEAASGQVNAAMLAGGIWEALLTTAAGLTVGIACLVAHQLFARLADRTARYMQYTVSALNEHFGFVSVSPQTQPSARIGDDSVPSLDSA